MAKSKRSKDKKRFDIVREELEEFKKLAQGHEKLIEAIGKL